MSQPLLFEINTRCWLRALTIRLGKPVTLASVPEEEIVGWKKNGFTHVWLMGAWTIGPKTLALARTQADLRALSVEAFGVGGEEKLVSSPYAIADYTVAESLGGSAALRQFRSRLHQHDLSLVLDFIPNHVGLDHRWLVEQNSLFVRSASPKPETFPVEHAGGASWVAHGKDPFFAGWVDTAQLDYRLPATRTAMTEVLQSVAAQCDGVRCDMAMLALNEIFEKTWAHFPSARPAPTREFWEEAISAVKKEHPHFLFMAEAYWDLEPRLQELGFDYVYDKKFYDYLIHRDFPALQRHVRAVAGKFNPVRFLENHDEPRIASLLTLPEQKAAAVLLLSQPGLRLLHDGQLTGARRRTPVQFAEFWPEPSNAEVTSFYDHLLPLLPLTVIGCGEMDFCDTGIPHCFAMKWTDAGRTNLVLVNLGSEWASFQLRDFGSKYDVSKLDADADSIRNVGGGFLDIRLAPHGFQLLELRPSAK
jgi:Alpha amylase, catalytic domain